MIKQFLKASIVVLFVLGFVGFASQKVVYADSDAPADTAKPSATSQMWEQIFKVGGTFDTSVLNPIQKEGASRYATIPEFIGAIIDTSLTLIVTLGMVGIIYGGFKMVISAAEPDQFSKGMSAFKYSLIGIVVAFMSFIIIRFVDAIFK